jgi:glycosyltransferase involved in cell wall biosynthesis
MKVNSTEVPQTCDQQISPSLKGARVIILSTQSGETDAEGTALVCARYLRDQHFVEVEIWNSVAQQSTENSDDVLRRKVVVPLPWSKNRVRQTLRLLKFAKRLRSARPDVIISIGSLQSVATGLIWKLTGARACIWYECSDKRERLGGRPDALAARKTTAFVADSQGGAEFFRNELGAESSRIHLIHRGIEAGKPQMDRTAWRHRLNLIEDCFVACMFADLKSSNDHMTLIKAWRIVVDRLASSNRNAVLILVGRFVDSHNLLKATAYDLELFDNVLFLGEQDDLEGLAQASDLCVHTALSETCPQQVLACMAAGLPLVATDYAGIREAVGTSGLEFLTPADNPEELAERIVKLATDPARREALGARNRQRIESAFNPRQMCQEIASVISEALLPSNGVIENRGIHDAGSKQPVSNV